MAWWMLNNRALVAAYVGCDEADLEYVFVFANTGMEHDDTLRFLNDFDIYVLCGQLVWLEAVPVIGERKKSKYRQVNYQTAFRNTDFKNPQHPYHAVVSKYGVANVSWLHCTRELKRSVMDGYLYGTVGADCTAIGIRIDEPRRVSPTAKAGKIIYPLIDIHPTDKQDVLDFWSQHPYDLTIPEWQGNCVTCFKKSLPKLNQVWIETPEAFEFNRFIETEYGFVGPEFDKGVTTPRVCFRGNNSTDSLIALFKNNPADPSQYINIMNDAGCSESCEPYETEPTP
jgi:hypothetical protein